MKTVIYTVVLILPLFGLPGCGGSGGGSDTDTTTTTKQVYSSSMTDINIVRTFGTFDKQPVPVSGLPVSGAEITVE